MSERTELFVYKDALYPDYLKRGNAMQFIEATALKFCQGKGLDVGAGRWPLPGSFPIDLPKHDAVALPEEFRQLDYIFSSHCLEHLVDPIAALEHWKRKLRVGGVLFLYLPSPDMTYWRPEHCRKHKHLFYPADVADALRTLGFVDVIHSERDLAWSFAVVGFNSESIK